MSLVFPRNNTKWKLTLLLIFHHQSHIWQNSGSWVMGQICCQPTKLQYSLEFNISRKKSMMKFIFGMYINIEVFHKLTISFWVCIARYAQSTQNKKFASLCNISRKTWEMKLVVRYYHNMYAFRVNLQSSVAWMSRNSLLKIGAISEV